MASLRRKRRSQNCRECPPGSRRMVSCGKKNAACQECPEETFSEKYNSDTECTKCKMTCGRKFEVIIENCTRTRDSVCGCPPGSFLRTPEDLVCEKHTACLKGYGVFKPGTPTEDIKCQKCHPRTFSDKISLTQRCVPHTTCFSLDDIRRHGNSSSDNKCNEDSSSGLPLGVWAAVIVAIFLVLIAIGTSVYCRYRKLCNKKRKNDLSAKDNGGAGQSPLLSRTANIRPQLSFKSLNELPQSASVSSSIENNNQPESCSGMSPQAAADGDDQLNDLSVSLSLSVRPGHPLFAELPGSLTNEEQQTILLLLSPQGRSGEETIVLEYLKKWRLKNEELDHTAVLRTVMERHGITPSVNINQRA